MSEYSMPSYFQTMPVIGKEVAHFSEENAAQIQEVEQEIHEIREAALEAGKSTEALNESGQWTAMQRIEELVDEGTWCPLNSLYNPQDNDNGSVGIVKGLGRINGKWAVIIASDNKKLAGAWVPGQADALLRGSDTAKRLRIPLVYVLNCSGVKLDEQEKVYPNRRGGGTPFYRNSELNQMGIPVIVGIYGTNPAGGGYHSISPTILIAHEDANMAVGGAGIVGGMNPKGYVDKEAAEALIQAQKNLKTDIPGTVSIHYDETGFFREVYCDEEGVLGGIRKYIDMLPAYDPEFFRVDDPKEPLFDANDLYSIVPFNQKRSYDMYDVMARVLEVRVEDLGDLGDKSTKEIGISSTCTVFAESEVISQLAVGTDKCDIIAGIHRSVAGRVSGLCNRVGVRDRVVMTGGVAQNHGIVKALENQLGHEISTSPLTQYNGALGAALFAYQKALKKQP